jgi:zinc transport system substrate-binding protein
MRIGSLAAVALFLLLSPPPPPALGADRLVVVASIFPLYEFAREVGGERVSVTLLIPPGSEAHHWEPRPSDVARLKQAGLFLYLGDFFETWAPRLARSAGVKSSLAAAAGLPLLHADIPRGPRAGEGNAMKARFDPHPWLDFSLCARMVDAVAAGLSRLDPPGAALYGGNASRYKDRLIEVELSYRKGLVSCANREFVFTGHAAFGYLAERFRLTQVPLYGLSPDSEPTPKAVAEAITLVRRKNLPVVFYDPLAGPKLADSIARETGATTLPLFPGHEITPAQWKEGVTFIGFMEQNLANLKRGLGCD